MAYTKQTWSDLPNTTTPINATRLNHMEDGIEDALTDDNIKNTATSSTTDTYSCDYLNKSIICAGTTTSSIDTNLNKLPLSTEIAKKGSKFTISNGSIIIGAGVSQIIVSAQLTFRDKTDNQKTLAVKLNGDTIISSLMIGNVQPTIIDTPKLINVSPNDVIELYTYQTAGTSLNINNNTNSTYIMVQEV